MISSDQTSHLSERITASANRTDSALCILARPIRRRLEYSAACRRISLFFSLSSRSDGLCLRQRSRNPWNCHFFKFFYKPPAVFLVSSRSCRWSNHYRDPAQRRRRANRSTRSKSPYSFSVFVQRGQLFACAINAQTAPDAGAVALMSSPSIG